MLYMPAAVNVKCIWLLVYVHMALYALICLCTLSTTTLLLHYSNTTLLYYYYSATLVLLLLYHTLYSLLLWLSVFARLGLLLAV